jgi:hypothetical protein
MARTKHFFFFEYAGFRQRLSTPVLISVPTATERQGIVAITPTNGAPYRLQVPVTPDASVILNKYPLPNNPNGVFGANTLQSAYSLPINTDQYSGRLDQRFSDQDSFFFRYSVGYNSQPVNNASTALINPSFTQGGTFDRINSGLSETHLFGPNLINEIRISGMQSTQRVLVPLSNQTQVTFADSAFYNYGPDFGGGGFSLEPFTMTYRDAITWVQGEAHDELWW